LGDADFVDAIKKIKKLDKQVEAWSFRGSLSKVLKKEVEDKNIHYLDDILDYLTF